MRPNRSALLADENAKITGLPLESQRALISSESTLTSVVVFEFAFPMNENVFVTPAVVTAALGVPAASTPSAMIDTIKAGRPRVPMIRFISAPVSWVGHDSSWVPAARILNVRVHSANVWSPPRLPRRDASRRRPRSSRGFGGSSRAEAIAGLPQTRWRPAAALRDENPISGSLDRTPGDGMYLEVLPAPFTARLLPHPTSVLRR